MVVVKVQTSGKIYNACYFIAQLKVMGLVLPVFLPRARWRNCMGLVRIILFIPPSFSSTSAKSYTNM